MYFIFFNIFFFFSSRRRHTRSYGDWSSDVCSSDLGCLDLGKADGRITQHACGGQRQRATRLDRDRALQRPVARNRLITSSSLEGADVQAKARTEARIRPGERLKDQHVIAGSRVRHPATERNRAAELVSQLSPPESVVVRWIHAQYEDGLVVIGVAGD